MRSQSQPAVQLSLLVKLAAAVSCLCQHGSHHRRVYLLVPFTADLQMVAEALLHRLGPHDRRLSGGSKGSRSV